MTPAWGRPAVSRLALAQRAHLRDELASRGITATCVVIADDENLDIARDYGFDTIEMDNRYLGRKVNAGFEFAAEQEPDYVAFIGSDDWMHPDLFEPLGENCVYAGHDITVIDLVSGRGKHLGWRHRYGVPPWFIPTAALKHCGYHPCVAESEHGMEFQIATSLLQSGIRWRFDDPHPASRVDFKSDVGMTGYDQITRALNGQEIRRPFSKLDRWYPVTLTNMALALHEEMSVAEVAT